jgi:hypothetical protein
MTLLLKEREQDLESMTNKNQGLSEMIDSLKAQIRQKNLFIDELRKQFESELADREMKLRLSHDSAMHHLRNMQTFQMSESVDDVYYSDKENNRNRRQMSQKHKKTESNVSSKR